VFILYVYVARVEVTDGTSCGLIYVNSRVFLKRILKEDQDARVDFMKTIGFLCEFP